MSHRVLHEDIKRTLMSFHLLSSLPEKSTYWKKLTGCSHGPTTLRRQETQVRRKDPSKLRGPLAPAMRVSFS